MAKKLKISACKLDSNAVPSADASKSFVVMINPEQYSIESSIKYVMGQGIGQGGDEWKFQAVASERISLGPIVLDGTGVVEGSEADPVPVADRIANLKKIVLAYDGSAHQTPVLQISWGGLVKYARLRSLKSDYILFKPDGTPLRARLTMEFAEYKSAKTIAAESKKSSPDLTHIVQVKAGDTLPLLCQRIYGRPGYHVQVARINGLASPRILAPGSTLTFPPLQD